MSGLTFKARKYIFMLPWIVSRILWEIRLGDIGFIDERRWCFLKKLWSWLPGIKLITFWAGIGISFQIILENWKKFSIKRG